MPLDRKDEPASVLLKRISGEKTLLLRGIDLSMRVNRAERPVKAGSARARPLQKLTRRKDARASKNISPKS